MNFLSHTSQPKQISSQSGMHIHQRLAAKGGGRKMSVFLRPGQDIIHVCGQLIGSESSDR